MTRGRPKTRDLDPGELAKLRALLAGPERLGADGLALVVESLPRGQRETFAIVVEQVVEGRPLDVHEVARRRGVHYTTAKRAIDAIMRALPAAVAELYRLRRASRSKT